MVIMNTAKDSKQVALKRFAERTSGFSRMRNIHTGTVTELKDLKLDAYTSAVFELLK